MVGVLGVTRRVLELRHLGFRPESGEVVLVPSQPRR